MTSRSITLELDSVRFCQDNSLHSPETDQHHNHAGCSLLSGRGSSVLTFNLATSILLPIFPV